MPYNDDNAVDEGDEGRKRSKPKIIDHIESIGDEELGGRRQPEE